MSTAGPDTLQIERGAKGEQAFDHAMSWSSQISKELGAWSAALYSEQLLVLYLGGAGLGICGGWSG
jgi:hypothetical protein